MFHRHLISSLLASFAIFAASSLAQAACCPPPCCNPCGAAPAAAPANAAPAAPVYKTITVMERVPEQYESVRTTYKTECVQEAYTAYRYECVPETRTINKTITKRIPEYRDEVRTVCKMVPTTETKTIMKKVTVCKQVTTTVRKCVDQGHWECIQVPAKEGFLSRLHKGCGDDCCNSCECPKMVTKKVWCPNKVWIECPVTKTVRCTECVPECVTVCVKKPCYTQETVKVCTYRCVTECVPTTCTVMVKKCIPYQATRTVSKCVPVQEKVLCTRYVCKPVTKQVIDNPCVPAGDACGNPCATSSGCCSPSRRINVATVLACAVRLAGASSGRVE